MIICTQTSASCSSSGLIRWSWSTGRLVTLPAINAEPSTGSHSQNSSIFQMNNCTRQHTFIYIFFSELLGNWRAQQCMSPLGLPVMEVFVVKPSRWVVCTVWALCLTWWNMGVQYVLENTNCELKVFFVIFFPLILLKPIRNLQFCVCFVVVFFCFFVKNKPH